MNLKLNVKNKKLRVFLIVFVLLISIPLSVLGYFEYNYQIGINLTKEKSWESAKVNLNRVKNYRDTQEIINYIDVRTTLNFKDIDPATYYDLIKSERDKLPEVYSGDLGEEITAYRVYLYNQMQLGQSEIKNDKQIQEAIELLKKGDYDSASIKLALKKDKNSIALFNYAMAMDSEKNGDKKLALVFLKKIPNDYKGQFAIEIKSKRNQLDQEIRKTEPPSIGMTVLEVIGSSWGKPQYINKTTTTYGVSEQWVYPNFKYVYLENGIVTAIQE